MKGGDTLSRHLYMLRWIPRYPRRISTAALKDRLVQAGFEATLRTIQRDLVKLSATFPLVSDEAKPQGWSWDQAADQVEMPGLEPQAALVFHFAQKYLQPLLPDSTLAYLEPWFRRADGVLDNQGNGLAQWRNKVRVLAPGQPLHTPGPDSEIQAQVTHALLHDKRLAISYKPRTLSGEEKQYEANPLGLVVRDQVIYLICTLRDYKDIKQLVLSRITKATSLDVPVKPLEGFDLDAYIAQGNFGWLVAAHADQLPLVADFDRDAALTFIERPLDLEQKVIELDAYKVRLVARVNNTMELRRWLLNFGPRVEVLEPASLREEMITLVVAMAKQYKLPGAQSLD